MRVECAEKTGFPGFDFCSRAKTAPCRGEDGSREKNCGSEERREATGYVLITTLGGENGTSGIVPLANPVCGRTCAGGN